MYHTCHMGGGFPFIVSEFVSDNDYKRIIVCKFCQNLKKQDTDITVLPSTSTVNIKLHIKFPWDISNICEYILITRPDYIYIGIHEGPHFRISSIAKLSREFPR